MQINTKLIAILTAYAFFVGGCGQSPTANNNDSQPPPAPIQAEPFHGQVYKSLKGSGTTQLTLISKDECELHFINRGLTFKNETDYACKYTDSNNALRVVTKEGEVVYFRHTDQGLVDNDGYVYFSPEGLAVEIQRQQIEKQRIADEKINAVRETQTISTFSLSPFYYNQNQNVSPYHLVLTDVSVKLYYFENSHLWNGAKEPPSTKIIYFTNLRTIFDVQGNRFGLEYSKDEDEDKYRIPYIDSESEAQARNVHDMVLNAFDVWRAKFPKAVNPEWKSSW